MLSLTPAAATKIQALCQKEGKTTGFLRIRVTSGGCSGLNLEFEISDVTAQDDKSYEGHGAKIVVDPKSEFFLYGSQIDYKSSLMKSGFVVNNPNAKDTCSCGTSFST
ncbi:MAG: iron-sulfur cluster assembly accessory protein [Elusimicrobia bacterium]|nr:iron-sulfur cluster assembly accessory protein [Elusimicrobiota bacterium]